MSYLIKDKVYDNRWVMVSGVLVKFEHSLAEVPEQCLAFFASNEDFEVLEHHEEVSETAVAKTPKGKPEKKGKLEG